MNTLEKLCALLASLLNLDLASVSESSEIVDDLGADALDLMGISNQIHIVFDVEITSTELEQLKTVSAVVKFINKHRAG